MTKSIIQARTSIPLTILFFIVCSTANAVSTIKNGNCPGLDEVKVNWVLVNTTEPKGGWQFDGFHPGDYGTAIADSLRNCSTRKSKSTNKYNNQVYCTYDLIWDNPQAMIRVEKTKPSNYDCTCDSPTGKYRCEVK